MAKVTGIGGMFIERSVLRAILSIGLVLALCGHVRAGDEKADPVGTWKCEYGIEGQKRTSTLTITKEGDSLAGTMSWPDQKETPLKDVKLTDGTLTFNAKRLLMNQEFTNSYELKIDGDTLKGKLTSDLKGKKGVFDLVATREKKDK